MPRRLRRLEPLACFALAGHALAVQFVAGESWLSPTIFAALSLTALGLAGVLGWQGPRAVTVRAFAVLVLAYSQMAIGAPGSGYFLLWFFVLVSVYPLVLPRRASLALVIASPLAYLLLLPLGAADGPAPVALLRAISLWLMGTFVHTAATAYRAAADTRDRALAMLDVYVDSTPVGLGFWDPSLRFRRLNAALARVSGLTVAQHLGRRVQEVPQVPSEIGVNLHRVLASGQPVHDVEVSAGDRVDVELLPRAGRGGPRRGRRRPHRDHRAARRR